VAGVAGTLAVVAQVETSNFIVFESYRLLEISLVKEPIDPNCRIRREDIEHS
jgi:hypothetical protein